MKYSLFIHVSTAHRGMDCTDCSCHCEVSSVAQQYLNLSNLCTIILLSTSSYM